MCMSSLCNFRFAKSELVWQVRTLLYSSSHFSKALVTVHDIHVAYNQFGTVGLLESNSCLVHHLLTCHDKIVHVSVLAVVSSGSFFYSLLTLCDLHNNTD